MTYSLDFLAKGAQLDSNLNDQYVMFHRLYFDNDFVENIV